MPFTMSESGTIQSVSIYHEGGTGNLILAVYDDSSGLPNTRLGVTESTPINGSAGWQTVELTSPVDVQEGQTIWLAWVFESNPGIRFEPGSPGRASSAQTWSGGMPESFGSSTTASYIYSIYATYTTEQEEAPELIGNPYMFTGRRFDIETGLYYYRARYYNPHIGRFMQTDPVGYSAGMNWYAYCGNNPVGRVDPSGLFFYGILERDHELALEDKVTFACFNDDDSIEWIQRFDNIEKLIDWRKSLLERESVSWRSFDKKIAILSNYKEDVYWDIMTLIYLNYEDKNYKSNLEKLDAHGKRVILTGGTSGHAGNIYWNRSEVNWYDGSRCWHHCPPLALLAHELGHAYAAIDDDPTTFGEGPAMDAENVIRYAFYKKIPGRGKGERGQVCPRPSYFGDHPDISWETYWDGWEYPNI